MVETFEINIEVVRPYQWPYKPLTPGLYYTTSWPSRPVFVLQQTPNRRHYPHRPQRSPSPLAQAACDATQSCAVVMLNYRWAQEVTFISPKQEAHLDRACVLASDYPGTWCMGAWPPRSKNAGTAARSAPVLFLEGCELYLLRWATNVPAKKINTLQNQHGIRQ